MEEEAIKEDEGKEKQDADSGKLLSHVQELEDELKDSEHKRIVLSHDNMALQMQLKARQEEEGCIRQELARLEERWQRSQVTRMVSDAVEAHSCVDPLMPNSLLSKTQLLMLNQLQDVSTRRSLSTVYRTEDMMPNPVRS